ncbi:MAG: hypothetical protein NTZ65_03300 [Candidatus Berkelbacteria bacterium]|nr:hypothetical protein [Candidatus Berkelbacteria bacterium]
MESNDVKTDSWRDIVSVLALFYIPPVGVIVMWFLARWSVIAKWVITILVGVIPLVVLGTFSYGGYKFAKFEKSYAPVMAVQQGLDFYGISNGKYPANLDDLKPKYIKDIPTGIEYTPSDDKKSYVLKGTVEGKQVELRPALANLIEK